MKKLLFLPLLFLISCAPRTYMEGYDSKTVKSFKNIAVIEPTFILVEVDEDYKKEIYDYDTEIKEVFKESFASYVKNSDSKYFTIDSTSVNAETVFELISKCYGIDMADSSLIEKILPNRDGTNKLLLSHVSGWYKTDELVNWESTKSLLYGIFTLGTYIPVYREYALTNYMVMIDLINYKVVYKDKREIYDDMRVKEQLSNIIKRALY